MSEPSMKNVASYASQGTPLGFPSDTELTRMANEMFANCGEFESSPFDRGGLKDDAPFTIANLLPHEGPRPEPGSLSRIGNSLPVDFPQPAPVPAPGLMATNRFASSLPFDPASQQALSRAASLAASPSNVPLNQSGVNPLPPTSLHNSSEPFAFLSSPSRLPQSAWEQLADQPAAAGVSRLGISDVSSARQAGVPDYQDLVAPHRHAGNPQAGGVRGFSPALAAANIPAQTSGGFDHHLARQDFPILSEVVNGKPLIWLDNAATTQKPNAVIERLSQFYLHENSNIHRAAHELARRSTDAYEAARESVARFINAPSTHEIIFVRGTTEAINLIAQSYGRQNIGEGDEIIITHLEHHANIVPWQQLCAEKKARLLVAPVDDSGQILLDNYRSLFSSRTKLVSLSQVSNALGTVTPAREMVDIAHRLGVPVVVDGAQSVSHMRVDVQELDCDFFVFSGHKVFGPTGIGVVFGKERILNDMPPWQGGGNMIQDVTFEKTLYHAAPMRFEAGTGNIADAVGLNAAIDYVQKLGIENISRYEHELLEYGTRELSTIPGLRMIGTAANKAGVLSFVVAGVETETMGKALSREGIAVRSGHHCAQPILRRFGVESTIRASLAFYNTKAEIDRLVSVVRQVVNNSQ